MEVSTAPNTCHTPVGRVCGEQITLFTALQNEKNCVGVTHGTTINKPYAPESDLNDRILNHDPESDAITR